MTTRRSEPSSEARKERPLFVRLLHSTLTQAVKITLLFICAPLAVVLSPIRRGRGIFFSAKLWSTAIMKVGGVRLETSGTEYVSAKEPQIIVSNHQGDFDIYSYCCALSHINFRFIVKKELFRLPVLGWALWLTGFPRIDRGNSRRAQRTMKEAGQRILRTKMSILAFPEGTRNTGKGLLRFKKGAFVLAIDLGVPIVPAVINGSQRVQLRRSYFINPGTIRVEFLDRIETKGLSYEDRDEVVRRVHAMILERLDPRDR